MKVDFLAVGDITTDAFIKLSEAWVETDNPEHAQELCMRFGGKIPYESVTVVRAVGNAPNAVVCAARLGLKSGLVANVGADENGTECTEVLRTEGVATNYVAVHKNIPTNYHFVLSFGAERTILVKHEAYPYALPAIEPAPKWLYLSSIGAGTERYHVEITDYLAKHSETKLAFQPGTFQIELGAALAPLYQRAEVLVVNREEAEKIVNPSPLPPPRGGSKRVGWLLSSLHTLGPKLVCITDGPRGAYFSDDTGEYFMPPYPDPKPPISRTGAGDAFAATFVSYLALGMEPLEALRRAPINSAFVVQQIGAQKGLLSREKLEEFLAHAPSNYQPQRI